jgi:LmbE family N-acetylglucosaminyl deacetylase
MAGMKEAIRRIVARSFATLLASRSRVLPTFPGPLLVIAPHPDDETLGCGGLIARQLRARAPVHVVFVTNGEASHRNHPTLPSTAVGELRRAEALAALGKLGAMDPVAISTFLAAPDGELDRLSAEEKRRVSEALQRAIAGIGPDYVCVPYRHGGSSEHSAVFALAETMCAESRDAGLLEYPVWAWWNAFRLRPQLARGAQNFRLPLGDLRAVKQAALACHRSQLEPTPPWQEAMLPRSLAVACCGPNEFYFQRASPVGGAA